MTQTPGPVPAAGPHTGSVTAFDSARGIGRVCNAAGTEFAFHATAIADGTRNIAVGTEVAFTVAPGHQGRYEVAVLASHQLPA